MKNLYKISASEREAEINKRLSQINSARWGEHTKIDRREIGMFIEAQREMVNMTMNKEELFEHFYTTAWNAVVLKNNVAESSPEASLVKQYIKVCKAVLSGGKVSNTYVTIAECWRWLYRIETSAISENLEALLRIQDFELMGGECDE